ncbi:MAG TPA: hypothetical protein VGX48_12585 [Pyrinomonadaceae bacterium]|jgi:hypothetical protein|nr:hypothetical protein [Pyrinomonadaceae bacterium]
MADERRAEKADKSGKLTLLQKGWEKTASRTGQQRWHKQNNDFQASSQGDKRGGRREKIV